MGQIFRARRRKLRRLQPTPTSMAFTKWKQTAWYNSGHLRCAVAAFTFLGRTFLPAPVLTTISWKPFAACLVAQASGLRACGHAVPGCHACYPAELNICITEFSSFILMMCLAW